MTQRIISSGLITCGAVGDGSAIRLDFLDEAARPVSVEFPFAQAQSLVMTLPGLLSRALRLHTRDDSSRFVFGLGRWSLESTDGDCIIMTLATEDGFQVSFGIPLATCEAMARALEQQHSPDFGCRTESDVVN